MPRPRTRRHALRALGTGLVAGLAGCTDDGGTTGTTDTSTETSTTSRGTGAGIDERETSDPPGEPALSPSGAWPRPRFDAANTGANPDGAGLRAGEQYWRLDAGGSASVTDAGLYNTSRRAQKYADLTRRDPATMAVESSTRLVQYGVNGPPVAAGGRVYVTTFIEVFYLAADRDAVLWRGPEMDGIQCPPAVADGTVYVSSGGFKDVPAQIRAFDAASGEKQWRYDTGSEAKGTPAVANDTVYVAARDGLHAVDAASGERLFRQSAVSEPWSTPVAAGGAVYAMGGESNDSLIAVDAASGDVRWTTRAPAMGNAPPVASDGRLYVGTESGLAALDPADGSVAAHLGGSGVPAALVGETLYAIDRGTLRALDADGDDELWSHETERVQVTDVISQSIGGVAPVDGAVYVSAADGFHGFGPVRD
ncbi:predicted cell surface protein/ lipoprotein [Halarchaeum acidiphilum MH1-52-1]|uniref:Predicted cell surface protein/ lipoprotein n=1 Tax=Halarchaeum acidiphilum MH1-52-1 TaxID=1261545 RepID=U3A1Q7_9EURY|nr:PQQ-binding-like beta-propeller repeat protein [Halarchaeum acidiphilum]GAD51584.1 predicted cell surface protein/ lipoprotein [Halarchaeum acidiphilum MH1-52-1]